MRSLLVGITTIESFSIMALQWGQHWVFQMIKSKKIHDENEGFKKIGSFLSLEVWKEATMFSLTFYKFSAM